MGIQHAPMVHCNLGAPMVELSSYDRDPQTHKVYYLSLTRKSLPILVIVRNKRFCGSEYSYVELNGVTQVTLMKDLECLLY